jgi:Tfp pilus assembly protein PilF/mono/diheme cytochrome c family protein
MLNARGLAACAVWLLFCSSQAAGQSPTFTRDVAPVLHAHCVACHQPEGDAPFSLITHSDAKIHARQIADVTVRRYMPPWKPDDVGAFVGERRLSEQEIAVLSNWAAAGAPEGTAGTDTASPMPNPSRWRNGVPDLIVTLPAYELPADGPDVFRNFVVPVPGHDLHYVRAWQFRPGNRAVHHANIRIDPTMASRRLDDADPKPGYEGVVLHSADYPDGHFLGWTPGQAAVGSDDLAWSLRGGTDLVVQLHMRPTGRAERVAPSIGFYFSNSAPSKTPAIVRLGRQNLDIPAGATNFRVSDAFTLPVDAQVVAIQPHAHYRARTVRTWASLPDGSDRQLIAIRDWDFNWQDHYRYATPFWLPAGTTLHMEYSFDNSNANPRNPDHPASRVSWGWRTADEMADVWVQVLTKSDRDRETLSQVARRKMATEDAVGSEVLIARDPDYVNLRNDAGLIYMELGQPAKAFEHFAAVTKLQPSSAPAWFNEGVALERIGRTDEARTRYAEAIRLDPSYSAAHNNLAALLYRDGNVRDAISHFETAVKADASNAEAHCAFARVLTETGDPRRAIVEYRAATATRPDWVPCLINFSWLLSAHADASIREPAEAIRLAERSVFLTDRQSAEALDALAAAYAAASRFDEATQTALAGERVAAQNGLTETAKQIHARAELYRRATAFVVR